MECIQHLIKEDGFQRIFFEGTSGKGAPMSIWQLFFLGVMVVLTPSMLVLGLMIKRLPTRQEVPDSPEDGHTPNGGKYRT
jgi:hypothetical protein